MAKRKPIQRIGILTALRREITDGISDSIATIPEYLVSSMLPRGLVSSVVVGALRRRRLSNHHRREVSRGRNYVYDTNSSVAPSGKSWNDTIGPRLLQGQMMTNRLLVAIKYNTESSLDSLNSMESQIGVIANTNSGVLVDIKKLVGALVVTLKETEEARTERERAAAAAASGVAPRGAGGGAGKGSGDSWAGAIAGALGGIAGSLGAFLGSGMAKITEWVIGPILSGLATVVTEIVKIACLGLGAVVNTLVGMAPVLVPLALAVLTAALAGGVGYGLYKEIIEPWLDKQMAKKLDKINEDSADTVGRSEDLKDDKGRQVFLSTGDDGSVKYVLEDTGVKAKVFHGVFGDQQINQGPSQGMSIDAMNAMDEITSAALDRQLTEFEEIFAAKAKELVADVQSGKITNEQFEAELRSLAEDQKKVIASIRSTRRKSKWNGSKMVPMIDSNDLLKLETNHPMFRDMLDGNRSPKIDIGFGDGALKGYGVGDGRYVINGQDFLHNPTKTSGIKSQMQPEQSTPVVSPEPAPDALNQATLIEQLQSMIEKAFAPKTAAPAQPIVNAPQTTTVSNVNFSAPSPRWDSLSAAFAAGMKTGVGQ